MKNLTCIIQWEVQLRERLNKELPEGTYPVGTRYGLPIYAGKEGRINLEVEMEKEVRRLMMCN